jgi:hypothetical protein
MNMMQDRDDGLHRTLKKLNKNYKRLAAAYELACADPDPEPEPLPPPPHPAQFPEPTLRQTRKPLPVGKYKMPKRSIKDF